MTAPALRFLLTADDKASAAFRKVRGEMAAVGNSSAVLRNTLGAIGPQLAAAFTVGAITEFINRTIEGVDALNDLKDATGASIENLSALEDVAARSGTSFETAGSALLKLNQSLNAAADPTSDAAAAFKALGLNVTELQRLDPVLALQKVGQAFNSFADNGNKGRISLELLNKSAAQLAPLLKDLGEAGRLNATVTTEQAEQAEKLRKEWFALQKNATDLSRILAGPMVSAINATIEKFREGAKEGKGFFQILREEQLKLLGIGSDSGITQLQKQIAGLDSALANPQLPEILRAGFMEKRAAAAAQLAQQLGDVKGTFLRGDKDTGPASESRPSLPSVLGKTDAAAIKRAAADRVKLAEFAAQQLVTLEEITAQETAEAWSYVNKSIVDQDKDRAEAFKEQWRQVYEFKDQQDAEDIERGQAYLDAIGDKSKDLAKDIGLVFSSAAGEAIRQWQGFSNLLKGIAQDLLQIAIKKTVTDPLTNLVSSGLGGFNLGSLFGGFMADGGPVSSGKAYMVGERGPEMFVPRSAGSIVPNGAGVVINQVINVGAGVNRNEVAAAMVAAKNSAVAQVSDAYRRGRSQ
jgi:ABC-type transporter Mla subunit MlaD